jgi:hypothetical protein
MKKLDHATKISFLTHIIRAICIENNLPKDAVIDDFIILMNMEEKDEEN